MGKTELYSMVSADYNYGRWSGRGRNDEALSRLQQIDINANVFYQNPGKMMDTMLDDNPYNPVESNAKIFSAGDLVAMQIADDATDEDVVAQENMKKTINVLSKLKPKLSTFALQYVRARRDGQIRAIENKRQEIEQSEKAVKRLDNILYNVTGTRLSKLGFGESALDWVDNPQRKNLMKRAYEDMLEDVAGLKRSRVEGGYRKRKPSQKKSRKVSKRKTKSSHKSRKH